MHRPLLLPPVATSPRFPCQRAGAPLLVVCIILLWAGSSHHTLPFNELHVFATTATQLAFKTSSINSGTNGHLNTTSETQRGALGNLSTTPTTTRNASAEHSHIRYWLGKLVWPAITAAAVAALKSETERICPFLLDDCLSLGKPWIPKFEFDDDRRKNLIMIGNPRSGKSTLLNGIARKPLFESGISLLAGLTKNFDSHLRFGIHLGDTPGLEDQGSRIQAAQAIKLCLVQGGQFKVFFVMTLEAGRVRPVDIATIKIVIEATGGKLSCFGIMVNKVSAAVNKQFGVEAIKKVISDAITNENIPRPAVFIHSEQKALKDATNKVVPLSSLLKKFIDEQETVVIPPSDVKDLQIKDFQKIVEEMEKKIKLLMEEKERVNEDMKKEMQEAKMKMQESNMKMQQSLDEKERLTKDLMQEVKEVKRANGDIQEEVQAAKRDAQHARELANRRCTLS